MSRTYDEALDAVLRWVEDHDYKGYEPSDGTLSPLHALTFNQAILERMLQQAVWKSPLDIRRLLGVPPHRSTKGTGYMAWGYLLMHRRTGEARYRQRAEQCFDWLDANTSKHYPESCWGDSFIFSSRGGRRPAFEPTLVWSSLIGQALLDGHRDFGQPRYLDIVASVCQWIKKLPRNETDSGICLAYTALGKSIIHNSNMLGAALLARFGQLTDDRDAIFLAGRAMEYSCKRQRPDGAWAYGDGPKYAWVDSFHTGYNLDSLRCYINCTGDHTYLDHLERGFTYFIDHFFEEDGRPRYYDTATYPIDIQCASQAIETLSLFSDTHPRAMPLAQKVAKWTIANMQDADGHFLYRDLRWRKIKTPMFHWGQATMFKALAQLQLALQPCPPAKEAQA